jgi:hypothetical protein
MLLVLAWVVGIILTIVAIISNALLFGLAILVILGMILLRIMTVDYATTAVIVMFIIIIIALLIPNKNIER